MLDRVKAEPEYTKVLVFMDVSSPDLVAPAAAAVAGIEAALSNLEAPNRVFIRVLVHGHQFAGNLDLDSVLLRFDRVRAKKNSHAGPPVQRLDRDLSAPYVPSDVTALREFVAQSLREDSDEAHPSRAVLFIWGHGQGVGNRLFVAGGMGQGLTAGIQPVNTLTLAGRGERSAVAQLTEVLQASPVRSGDEGRRLDLVVLDSCLMATAEIAYEFRSIARFFIASQSFVMLPGMNLGRSIAEYLSILEGRSIERQPPVTGGNDKVLNAAQAIVDLTGALGSGASQLTLFRLDAGGGGRTDGLASWLAAQATLVTSEYARDKQGNLKPRQKPRPDTGGYRPPSLAAAFVDGVDPVTLGRYPWYALFTAFVHLLRWASADAEEAPRIVAAFERARFYRARQHLDLKDLARQVHAYSRLNPLQLVALELMRELEESPEGFVVRWRATIPENERKRFGGVSIYCPWFLAEGDEELDTLVDYEAYRALELPRSTSWSGFVFGALYESLVLSRQRARQASSAAFDETVRWLRILKRTHCSCDSLAPFEGSGPGKEPGSSGGPGKDPGSSGGPGKEPGSQGGPGKDPGSSGGPGKDPGSSGGPGKDPGSMGRDPR